MSRPTTETGSVWRNPSYLRLWIGETFSQAGEQVGALAIPVLAVLVLQASAAQVGLLNAAESLAFLVIGLPVGAWVDRMRKRRVMMAADLTRALLLACIPVLWALNVLQMWQLMVISALVGAASTFFDVTYQSYIPRLVPSQQIASANSGMETSAQVARVAGPAASGGLIALMPAPLVVLATAIGYLFSFGFVASIKDAEPMPPRSSHPSLVREIGEGLGFVFRNPLLRRLTVMTAASNLFGGLVLTLWPLLILRTLGISPAIYGVVMTLGAVGGILGAMGAPRLARWIGEGRIIVVVTVMMAVSLLLAPLAALAGVFAIPVLVLAEFLYGFCVLVFNVSVVSFRQRICPPPLLGRMNASVRFLVWGVIPISAATAGWLGTTLGIVPTMWIGSALALLSCGIVVFSPLRRIRRLPRTAEE